MTILDFDKLKRDTKREAKRKRPPVQLDDGRVIRLGPDLHRVVDDAVDALRDDAHLYQRDGQLVHLVRVAEVEAEREGQPAGTPQIRAMAIPTLRERLTGVSRWAKYDKRADDYVQTTPPDQITGAVAARGEWSTVRPLVGILEAPSMRPDGSLIDTAGYDAATGYVYAPSASYLGVLRHPGQDDARRALEALREPFADFPFATPEARDVPVAAILSLLARPAIRGSVPAFVFDASTRGSGKSLLADVVALIATGRGAARMNWPPDEVELEKILASYALRGANFVCFDNVCSTFGGGPLDRVLTATDRVELRVLGKSEVPSLSWRAVVFGTGNNVVLGADTTRRVLVARLEPSVERPEERTDFAHPSLLAWVLAERPRLVQAALTLLRAYVMADRPAMGLKPWGSYEAWSALIPAAIAWAGGSDVMACRPTVAGADDDDTVALRVIVAHWPRLAPNGLTMKNAIAALYPRERLRGDAAPDGFDELRESLESLAPTKPGMAPNAHKLGNVFRRYRRRVVGNAQLDSVSGRSGVLLWLVCGGTGGTGGTSHSSRERIVSDSLGASSMASPTSLTSPTKVEEDEERKGIQVEDAGQLDLIDFEGQE